MERFNKFARNAKISDIAELAGVGTATVDRVLNNRGSVRNSTLQRVMQAKSALEQGRFPVNREKPWRLKVFLPAGAGGSTEHLAQCFQDIGSKGNATIECQFIKKLEPGFLARKLNACAGQGVDAVAFQALEDPRVYDAVNYLRDLNIPSLALLTGNSNQNLIGTVGMDNRAAGRTAGFFIGRFTRQVGSVAIVTGGQLYQIHEEREMGLRFALRNNFHHIKEVLVLNGQDDAETNYEVVRHALENHTDLVGIYNVGGGSAGIVEAMREMEVKDELIFVGHNLTTRTQSYLLEGFMDIVLHLNMRDIAMCAVEAMISHLENRECETRIFPTQVVTRENIVGVEYT